MRKPVEVQAERIPMPHTSSSIPNSHYDPIIPMPFWCLQGVLGLMFAGITLLIAFELGFVTVAVPLSPAIDSTQRAADVEDAAAAEPPDTSAGVIVAAFELFATTFGPFLASGLCGVFAHRSLPASIPTALLRTGGLALLLSMVAVGGIYAIDGALSTGQSSDILAPLTGLTFCALCISLAAPLSSAVTRRRSPSEDCGAPENPRPAVGSRV
jgi:hypothetical protein